MRIGGFQKGFTISVTATETAVRGALAELRKRLKAQGISRKTCGSVELAMAEALNNIVEHAYASSPPGQLTISTRIGKNGLQFVLTDTGEPMPNLSLPPGELPDNCGPMDTLPEGGFGWFLIHELTTSLTYCRENGENRLTLEFSR